MEEENKIDVKTSTPSQSTKEGVVGPIIGSTIIILLIVLGGLYFWSYLIEKREVLSEEKTQENLETEVTQLENEIQADELEKIDEELMQIEAEIDSALIEEDTKVELE